MLSPTRRERLLAQGWLDDGNLHQLAPWARLAPAVCMLVIVAAVLSGTTPLLWVLVPIALTGAASARHPIDALYNAFLSPRLGTPRLPRCGAPRRFACGVAAAWLCATALAFTFEEPRLGFWLGGLMAAALFFTAALDLCLPCYVFPRLRRALR